MAANLPPTITERLNCRGELHSPFNKIRSIYNVIPRELLTKIKESILDCKASPTLNEIKNIKKKQGYQTFYRLKIGDYRIGLEIVNDELIFVRFLHRKENYRFFPPC